MAYVVEPLYYTDMKYYSNRILRTAQEVIHVAKNEFMPGIYIFGNEDLQNYFWAVYGMNPR